MDRFLILTELYGDHEYEHITNIRCIEDISIADSSIEEMHEDENTKPDGPAVLFLSSECNIATGVDEGHRPHFSVKETYQEIKARMKQAGVLI